MPCLCNWCLIYVPDVSFQCSASVLPHLCSMFVPLLCHRCVIFVKLFVIVVQLLCSIWLNCVQLLCNVCATCVQLLCHLCAHVCVCVMLVCCSCHVCVICVHLLCTCLWQCICALYDECYTTLDHLGPKSQKISKNISIWYIYEKKYKIYIWNMFIYTEKYNEFDKHIRNRSL